MAAVRALSYEDADWQRFSERPPKSDDERSPGEVDRSRLVHSAAFRRLLGKTQVFGIGQDSFFRTRLTHSIEVAQIAKGIALRVGADPEVCEAAALAHDLGHPPFGHKGEAVLGNLMESFGGFEANAQNFRILTKLEIKYSDPEIRGLDLTRAVLDGILKYRQPSSGKGGKLYYTDDPDVVEVIKWAMQGQVDQPLECEIMDWADDIAYSVHDLEDGIYAGMITSEGAHRKADEILADARAHRSECSASDVEGATSQVVRCENQPDERSRMATRKEVTSELINSFLKVGLDPVRKDRRDLGRHGSRLRVSQPLRRQCQALKSMTYIMMIDDARVASLEARAERILADLFNYYRRDEATRVYPEPFRMWFEATDSEHARARVACDFIAGMTDEYAERVYSRMFTPIRSALSDY